MRAIYQVPVNECVSLGNVRQVVMDAGLKELAKRMAEFGQERPIDVYMGENGEYIILHGHRRHAAARLNGWDVINAIVHPAPSSADEVILRQYFDNETAQALTFLEKARAWAALKEIGWSQQEIAAQFGISPTTVSQALSSLKAHPKLQDAVNKGRISPSAIEPLLSLPIEEQALLADAAIQRKTAAGVVDLVRSHKALKSSGQVVVPDAAMDDDFDIDPLEALALDDLQDVLNRLQQLNQNGIQHPTLRRKARPTVQQLIQLAQALDASLRE